MNKTMQFPYWEGFVKILYSILFTGLIRLESYIALFMILTNKQNFNEAMGIIQAIELAVFLVVSFLVINYIMRLRDKIDILKRLILHRTMRNDNYIIKQTNEDLQNIMENKVTLQELMKRKGDEADEFEREDLKKLYVQDHPNQSDSYVNNLLNWLLVR